MSTWKKILYYVLNCTWGIIMTLIGAIGTLALAITGHKVKRHAGCFYTNVGHAWGGMEAGMFFFTDDSDSASVKNHEFGHSLQNCLWGPLLPFIVCIPSATRYWLRENPNKKSKQLFANIYYVIAEVIGLITLGVSILKMITPLIVISAIWVIYFSIIYLWMTKIEIPKYDEGKVAYDDIWFEKQATNWGDKVAPTWDK